MMQNVENRAGSDNQADATAVAGGSLSDRRLIALLSILPILVGLGYIFLIRPGTPADEVAHYVNLRYYATHLRMPVMGPDHAKDDRYYESYQGPAYYTLAAILYRLTRGLGDTNALYILRFAGLLFIYPLTALTFLIARRLAPKNRTLQIATTLFVALNPCVLAMGLSIQNDMLAMVFAFATMYLSGLWIEKPDLAWRNGVGIGLTLSVAMLAKVTTVSLIVPILLYALLVRRKQALPFCVALVGTVALLTGWFFVRNQVLYGDIMAVKAVMKYHPEAVGGARVLWKPKDLVHISNLLTSYYFTPGEYYRNLLHAPIWLRIPIVLFMLVGVGGFVLWCLRASRDRDLNDREALAFARFLQFAYLVSLFTYLFALRNGYFAPRAMYPVFVVFGLGLSMGGIKIFAWLGRIVPLFARSKERLFVPVLLALLLTINLYTLVQGSRFPIIPPNLPFISAK